MASLRKQLTSANAPESVIRCSGMWGCPGVLCHVGAYLGAMQPTTGIRVEEQVSESPMSELTRAECLDLLASQQIGRLAVMSGWKTPIIRPVNYLYDQPSQSIVFRTAAGSKLRALRNATRAAFEIDGTDPRAGYAWSVIVEGVTTEVTRAADLARLNRLNFHPLNPDPKPYWIAIGVWTVSGRRILLPGHRSR